MLARDRFIIVHYSHHYTGLIIDIARAMYGIILSTMPFSINRRVSTTYNICNRLIGLFTSSAYLQHAVPVFLGYANEERDCVELWNAQWRLYWKKKLKTNKFIKTEQLNHYSMFGSSLPVFWCQVRCSLMLPANVFFFSRRQVDSSYQNNKHIDEHWLYSRVAHLVLSCVSYS